MHTFAGGYGTSQMPLAGAILCCTSISPEQRTELASIGAQMGATIKLDLTSDVTHLIVGNISSAKYRYVAKAREDVRVLTPEWLEALRALWMEGDDVDVAALEREYRLPTFYGLNICLTGFDNPDQRKYIQEMATQNGAEYHGDLTKTVTHLIAATPTGKKYEHAVNWRMKIVSREWFEQSLQRGMTLDEDCYHPTKPVEERGYGAWDRRRSTSPTLGKRSRDIEQATLVNPRQRKLRRSASSRMGIQSEALWAGITAGGLERKIQETDDWTDDGLARSLPTLDPPEATCLDENAHAYVQDDAQPANPASHAPSRPTVLSDGIFQGRMIFTWGFDSEKTKILQDHLGGNGATVIRQTADLAPLSADDLNWGFVVIPHDVETDVESLPGGAGAMTLVTNWWVERCVYTKALVDPTEHVLCRPFDKLAVSGFSELTINSTAFTGIELLQVTKVVALMGATYDEFLTTKTSVIVCNTRKPNADKFRFATDKRIPAVHATWLWESVATGEAQPYDKYLLNRLSPLQQKPRERPPGPFEEVPTAPLSEEDSLKLRERKQVQNPKQAQKPHSRTGAQPPGALSLTISADPTPSPTTASTTHPNTTAGELTTDQDDSFFGNLDGSTSLPLQDINPSVNSPPKPSISSNTSLKTKSSATLSNSSSSSNVLPKPVPTTCTSRRAPRHPTPDSVIPPPTDVAVHEDNDDEKKKETEKEREKEKDYSSIMSNILAQRKAASAQNPFPLNPQEASRQKRRRQLGRAPSARSNPSTADGKPLSRASSVSAPANGADAEAEPDGAFDSVLGPGETEFGRARTVEVYQPSQELGWDAHGAQEAREQMIRAMGGKVERVRGVVVRDVGGESGLGVGGRTRRRRG
ncbi:hypothetical protein K491DRAFT_698238 [Lophiostoma macrostomum CBS 122681]|uniref:BRCT domain-containing protein n=1 Tax=Lophiostoma macrostomum CBS 122681 TaxID=1314788 RepID=A0A6A6SNJ8_9PLEO|nr:hypothetical protein K491DRAFT_698238 [Lophiostoma macrostomum CBS 122681]